MTMLVGVSLFFISLFLLFIRGKKMSGRVPPGSLGIPIVGQTLSFLQAMRANTAEKWLEQWIQKNGPVSKMSLFGKPTIFIHGQAANKFVYTTDGSSSISSQQSESTRRIFGDRNILELNVEDHKRVKTAIMQFLKPDSLKNYVGKMDVEIRKHLEKHWHGKQQVTVFPLMKHLSFNIICTLIFGLEQGGTRRDELLENFTTMMRGMLSLPINFPFTRYNKGLKASKRVHDILGELVREKRIQLEQKTVSPQHDLITNILSMRNEDGKEEFTQLEIVDNITMIMVAGHDTSSAVLTFILRVLANEPAVCATVLQEQEEIARSKLPGELLTWQDLTKMKYTWAVAQETLRTTPPVILNFRNAMKDIEFNGFLIPKGWQIFWATPMTHMDNSLFPEPSKFDPSRFHKLSPKSVPPYSFIPFGRGPRMCPGNEFARIEILIAMHHLVTQFKWKQCADNRFIRDPMPVPTKGLPFEITPRAPL